MSRLDGNIINNIKLLSLDIIKECKCGNPKLSFIAPQIISTLFLKHLNFDKNNPNWINRDRVIVSNELLPVMYSTMHMMGFDISLDNLKEYNKFNSSTIGFGNINSTGIEVGSLISGDVISTSIGISLGERYLESLIKKKNAKCNLIDFRTYCICTYKELLTGLAYESLSFLKKEKLNKLTFIVINDNDYKEENLTEKYTAMKLNVINLNDNDCGSIDEAIDDAKDSKKPTIIFVSDISKEHKLFDANNGHINILREKYKLNESFSVDSTCYDRINKTLDKRLSKIILKWNNIKNEYNNDLIIDGIVKLLERKTNKISFKADNLKINDNYEEELIIGNNKIFNVLASKSPFILNLSASESKLMIKNEDINRNIIFDGLNLAMGGIANGLASLGFRVFVSAPLKDSNILRPFIVFSTRYNLAVNYVFCNGAFLNTYDNNGLSPLDEINSLRLIPNLINFRPADINEIIGIYSIIANYKKSYTIILSNEKRGILTGTNSNYVIAGAYRLKREKGEANGILLASGTEVDLALKVSEELLPYGIDLRVVSIPSIELFEMQNERYKCSLIPKELKTFIIEIGSNTLWLKYTEKDCIFGVDDYTISGDKEELLRYYKLDVDSIKTKIIEIMKNN